MMDCTISIFKEANFFIDVFSNNFHKSEQKSLQIYQTRFISPTKTSLTLVDQENEIPTST